MLKYLIMFVHEQETSLFMCSKKCFMLCFTLLAGCCQGVDGWLLGGSVKILTSKQLKGGTFFCKIVYFL